MSKEAAAAKVAYEVYEKYERQYGREVAAAISRDTYLRQMKGQ